MCAKHMKTAAECIKAQNWQGALDSCALVLMMDPGNNRAKLIKGKALLSLAQYDDALECFEDIIQDVSENITSGTNAAPAKQQARQHSNIKLLADGMANTPLFFQALMGRIQVLKAMKRVSEAIQMAIDAENATLIQDGHDETAKGKSIRIALLGLLEGETGEAAELKRLQVMTRMIEHQELQGDQLWSWMSENEMEAVQMAKEGNEVMVNNLIGFYDRQGDVTAKLAAEFNSGRMQPTDLANKMYEMWPSARQDGKERARVAYMLLYVWQMNEETTNCAGSEVFNVNEITENPSCKFQQLLSVVRELLLSPSMLFESCLDKQSADACVNILRDIEKGLLSSAPRWALPRPELLSSICRAWSILYSALQSEGAHGLLSLPTDTSSGMPKEVLKATKQQLAHCNMQLSAPSQNSQLLICASFQAASEITGRLSQEISSRTAAANTLDRFVESTRFSLLPGVTKLSLLTQLAVSLTASNEWQKGKEKCRYAIESVVEIMSQISRKQALHLIAKARCCQIRCMYEMNCYQEIIELFSMTGSTALMPDILNILSTDFETQVLLSRCLQQAAQSSVGSERQTLLSRALKGFVKCAKLKSSDARPYLGIGTILAKSQQNYSKAAAAFEKALAIDPTSAYAYTQLFKIFCAHGKFKDCTRVVAAAPEECFIESREMLEFRAVQLWRARKYLKASDELQRLLSWTKESDSCRWSSDIWTALGSCYRSAHRHGAAEMAFRKSYKFSDLSARESMLASQPMLIELAHSLVKLGQIEEAALLAEQVYACHQQQEAISFSLSAADIQKQCAIAAFEMGRFDESRAHIDRALDFIPAHRSRSTTREEECAMASTADSGVEILNIRWECNYLRLCLDQELSDVTEGHQKDNSRNTTGMRGTDFVCQAVKIAHMMPWNRGTWSSVCTAHSMNKTQANLYDAKCLAAGLASVVLGGGCSSSWVDLASVSPSEKHQQDALLRAWSCDATNEDAIVALAVMQLRMALSAPSQDRAKQYIDQSRNLLERAVALSIRSRAFWITRMLLRHIAVRMKEQDWPISEEEVDGGNGVQSQWKADVVQLCETAKTLCPSPVFESICPTKGSPAAD